MPIETERQFQARIRREREMERSGETSTATRGGGGGGEEEEARSVEHKVKRGRTTRKGKLSLEERKRLDHEKRKRQEEEAAELAKVAEAGLSPEDGGAGSSDGVDAQRFESFPTTRFAGPWTEATLDVPSSDFWKGGEQRGERKGRRRHIRELSDEAELGNTNRLDVKVRVTVTGETRKKTGAKKRLHSGKTSRTSDDEEGTTLSPNELASLIAQREAEKSKDTDEKTGPIEEKTNQLHGLDHETDSAEEIAQEKSKTERRGSPALFSTDDGDADEIKVIAAVGKKKNGPKPEDSAKPKASSIPKKSRPAPSADQAKHASLITRVQPAALPETQSGQKYQSKRASPPMAHNVRPFASLMPHPSRGSGKQQAVSTTATQQQFQQQKQPLAISSVGASSPAPHDNLSRTMMATSSSTLSQARSADANSVEARVGRDLDDVIDKVMTINPVNEYEREMIRSAKNIDLFGSFITAPDDKFDFFETDRDGQIILQPKIPIFPEDFPPGKAEWPLSWWGIVEPSKELVEENENPKALLCDVGKRASPPSRADEQIVPLQDDTRQTLQRPQLDQPYVGGAGSRSGISAGELPNVGWGQRSPNETFRQQYPDRRPGNSQIPPAFSRHMRDSELK